MFRPFKGVLIKMKFFLASRDSISIEKFDLEKFDYNVSPKQCLKYGQNQLEPCEFKVEITEIKSKAIDPATAYTFHIQLIAPDLKVKTQYGDSDPITHIIPMQSNEKTLKCQPKLNKIQGKSLVFTKTH